LRFGITPTDRWLIYATGGFAVAGVGASVNAPGIGLFSQTQTRWGWAVGGGAEAAVDQNWSVKIEYLYVDLQNQNFLLPPSSGLDTPRTVILNDNILRAGINYRFDWSPFAVKY
jgi:outer membrane immunogenic protein